MNATLSLGSQDDLDATMRLVARNLAMGIYDLDKILGDLQIDVFQFARWRENPRFIAYLKAETDAWNSAQNTSERTKLKAGIVVEEWLADAYSDLRDRKIALSQRVELGKLLARIAGMGEPKTGVLGVSEGGGGFTLQINIGQNAHVSYESEKPVIDVTPEEEAPAPQRMRGPI